MDKKIIAILALSLFILGCMAPGQNTTAQKFQLGSEFTISPGNKYEETTGIFTITDINITDSRCQEGVQCFWEGELGVAFIVHSPVSSKSTGEAMFLGEKTRPSEDLFAHTFTLINVNEQNNSATIKVTKKAPLAQGESSWFAIEPVQCGGNKWDEWGTLQLFASEEARIAAWLEQENGIDVAEIKSRDKYEIVCEACSCPRGDEVAVLVNSGDYDKMQTLGWKNLSPVACTLDAKICPDGSAVGREAPFCEFTPCQNGNGDGNAFFIQKVDEPGFVLGRKVVTTTIYDDGRVVVGSEQFFSGRQDVEYTERTSTLSEEELEQLKSLVRASDFFEITEDDARQCVADAPSKNLEINLDGKSNRVYGIGNECDSNKVQGAVDIIAKVESLVPTNPIIVNMAVPGFAPREFQKSSTMEIFSDGSVKLAVTEYDSDAGENRTESSTRNISQSDLNELLDFIKSTNFFSISEEDARQCVIDAPYKMLEINIDANKTHKVTNIGVECEPEKTKAARDILEKIGELVQFEDDGDPAIVKTDVPGFTLPEFANTIVTKIYEDGNISIETTYGGSGEVETRTMQVAKAEVAELLEFIESRGFFEAEEIMQ
ncbi:MAG: hypothetical protein NUV67_05920, partial [archaeon]|nr:hypothetical protein [archaeon]